MSISIAPDNSQLLPLVFLPVTDLSTLLVAVAALTGQPAVKGDDGIYSIPRESGALFAAEKRGYVYLARRKSALQHLPGDPLQQSRGLDKQYDLALSADVHHLPPALREMVADRVRQYWEAKPPQNAAEGGEERSAARAKLARRGTERTIQLISDLHHITLGLSIDRANHRTRLDLEITALPDSSLARSSAALKQAADPRLAGVLASDAIASVLFDWPLPEDDEALACAYLDRLREGLPALIRNALSLEEEKETKAKDLTGKLFDLFDQTIEKRRRINFGLAVFGAKRDELDDIIGDAIDESFPGRIHETIIGAGQVAVVAGGVTADGAEWERVAMELVGLVAEAAELDPPKLNVDTYQGWRFHALSVTAPQTMRAELPLRALRNLLGNPIKIVLAFGEDTSYAAVGENGADAIKRLIDRSAKSPASETPLTASLALAPAWKLLFQQTAKPQANKIAAELKKIGKDRVTITAVPTESGVRCRLECEEGANLLLGGILSIIVRAVAAANGA
ncbi:MAG TPA: hypothetical protein VJ783_19295 [Pirellulales bacterium]|nr:hypothetical protein [Pirellulales bacterium]